MTPREMRDSDHAAFGAAIILAANVLGGVAYMLFADTEMDRYAGLVVVGFNIPFGIVTLAGWLIPHVQWRRTPEPDDEGEESGA